ncbi:MAG: FAD-dependent oxidoreductase [Acetivibrionales bacterium]|jgi:hypothetical protein
MVRVVIIGGGWSGCAAAVSARKAGAETVLLERTDMLLGTGLVGGIMRNNGRYTAAEEMIAMGGGDLIEICDKDSRHKNVEFPGHKHASLYDIALTHGDVLKCLDGLGVKIFFKCRIVKLNRRDKVVVSVQDSQGKVFEGDVFIDATGTAGPISNCTRYGNGCAMCIIRCPSFGGRESVTRLAGVEERVVMKDDGSPGAMSGSCKILKESLSEQIQETLNKKGVVIIALPEKLIQDHLRIKVCQQYANDEFRRNVVLLDTGHAKLMAPYFNLELLRQIPGLENVRYEDPYAGGIGNSMRLFAIAPRDNHMKVEGVENLFCCGEKAGALIGHTEAIITGTLAGNNSVRHALGADLIEIPQSLACGDAVSFVKNEMDMEENMSRKYTFSGSVYFERMKELGLYTLDKGEIADRVKEAGMYGIFSSIVSKSNFKVFYKSDLLNDRIKI